MCLSLLTGWVMPRCLTIIKAEGGPGTLLCPCLCTADVRESRAKEREIISSSSRATLTHSYLPFLKKDCSKTRSVSIPLSLAFLFLTWSWASPCSSTFLPQKAQLYHSDGQRRTHVWERLLERAMGCSSSGLSQRIMEPNCYTCSGNHCISTALQFSPQQRPKFHWGKKKWGGGRRSQKNYCVPKEGKRWTALFSLSSFADVNHFSHFKQQRHHFSPPVPLFIMLCISHELSLMQNLYIVRGHPNIFNDLKQSDWH